MAKYLRFKSTISGLQCNNVPIMYYGLCKLFFLGINDYVPLPGALLCVKKGIFAGHPVSTLSNCVKLRHKTVPRDCFNITAADAMAIKPDVHTSLVIH